MAHDYLYQNTNESRIYVFDFADELTGDTALNNIGSGSTITAFSSDGTDVSATVLSSKTRTGMTLSVVIGTLTDGEEYRVEFVGQGSTTSAKVTLVLEVRARKYIQGGF